MTNAKITNAEISEEGKQSLRNLQEALLQAEYTEMDNGDRKYSNKSLDKHMFPLLQSLGLQHLGYTAWRILNPTTIRNKTGPDYIIPIRILSSNPQIIPGGPLEPGMYICHDGKIDLLPELECVFVTRVP